MTKQSLNDLIAKTIRGLLVTDSKIKSELDMSNFLYYQFKKDNSEVISNIKKGFLVEQLLIKTKKVNGDIPDCLIKRGNERMNELYLKGIESKTLLKVEVFTALIKPDNKKGK